MTNKNFNVDLEQELIERKGEQIKRIYSIEELERIFGKWDNE